MRRWMTLGLVLSSTLLAGCRHSAQEAESVLVDSLSSRIEQPKTRGLIEMLPGVRVDPDRGLVEFDAVVAMDCHDPETPDVFLEVVCCTRDTREHEALVVTGVLPSSVHAALLVLGGVPGTPGSWRKQAGAIHPVPPAGGEVRVSFLTREPDDSVYAHDPAEWVIQKETRRTLRETLPATGWVFAGSRMRLFRGREVYDADGTGQLIGLHTFGSETIAWTRIESPDSGINEPQWMANAARVPPIGTRVTVRLELGKAEESIRPSGASKAQCRRH